VRTPDGVKVDLLFASSGIERETVARATNVSGSTTSAVPQARLAHRRD
jgi:hypothetical protein